MSYFNIVTETTENTVVTEYISDGARAEIAARQKQYEYYRDKLLTFKVKE